MQRTVRSYKSVEGQVDMPILRPVRIKTQGLSWWGKTIKYFKAREWELVEDYKLYIPWLEVTLLVPAGYIFNAASIPRLFWVLINPTGTSLIPSIFHDFDYAFDNLLDANREKLCIPEKDRRKFFDALFRDMGIYVNGYSFISNITYSALRGFGGLAWYKHRKVDKSIEDYFELTVTDQVYCEYQEID